MQGEITNMKQFQVNVGYRTNSGDLHFFLTHVVAKDSAQAARIAENSAKRQRRVVKFENTVVEEC